MTDMAGPAGHLATPAGAGPWPGVIVIHEIFGLNDDIRALTDRVAMMGYLALAPDFYHGGRWTQCMKSAFSQLQARQGEFFDAIESARAQLASSPQCSGRVGVIGFCLGGGFALLTASRYDFDVASVNYGDVPIDAATILDGACPIVASYGGRDRTVRGHPERLDSALTSGNIEHDVKVYADAGHSFLSVRRYPLLVRLAATAKGMHPGPHAPSADDAWRRIETFFRAHLLQR
jgi:carboxymethylenebutenolidase